MTPDYGMGGLAKLARVGAAALVVLAVVVPVGLATLGWWAWNCLEIRIARPEDPKP